MLKNVYFGKPCGLMDQMASSIGNLVHIDFANPEYPYVEKKLILIWKSMVIGYVLQIQKVHMLI